VIDNQLLSIQCKSLSPTRLNRRVACLYFNFKGPIINNDNRMRNISSNSPTSILIINIIIIH